MVTEDGELAPLESDPPTGICPSCSRPFDLHHFIRRRDGSRSNLALCPLRSEAYTFGPLLDDKEKK